MEKAKAKARQAARKNKQTRRDYESGNSRKFQPVDSPVARRS
jgi:hypothetical protein